MELKLIQKWLLNKIDEFKKKKKERSSEITLTHHLFTMKINHRYIHPKHM